MPPVPEAEAAFIEWVTNVQLVLFANDVLTPSLGIVYRSTPLTISRTSVDVSVIFQMALSYSKSLQTCKPKPICISFVA